MAGTALKTSMKCNQVVRHLQMPGMTLIELVIVMAVVAILMALAVPAYTQHSLRVHRSEAIRLLLQASICQERVYAGSGSYDTGQCVPNSEHNRYQLTYQTVNSQAQSYTAVATPVGVQTNDVCGSLQLDQSGLRGISAATVSVSKCWNGR